MKVGMVLEGGAMRGMYTAGVMDVLMDNNINVDGIVGVSAGALFGVNYFSKQRGRVIRYSKRFSKDLRYISVLSKIFTGNVVNKNFAYYKVPTKLDIFDDAEFVKNNKCYYAVVTNVKTGKPEYKKIEKCLDNLEVLRASSALPLASKIIELDGEKYLDGGISDPIPVMKCKKLGFDKIIVILTQPYDYRKEPIQDQMIKKLNIKFKKYPKLVNTMIDRHNNYNKTIEKIIEMEKNEEIFVIRPSKRINIKLIERNRDKLQEVYDLGVSDSNKIIENLKKYLELT